MTLIDDCADLSVRAVYASFGAHDGVEALLSESNAWKDRTEKLPLYARSGVKHVWLVDPLALSIEVYRLDGETYR